MENVQDLTLLSILTTLINNIRLNDFIRRRNIYRIPFDKTRPPFVFIFLIKLLNFTWNILFKNSSRWRLSIILLLPLACAWAAEQERIMVRDGLRPRQKVHRKQITIMH